MHSYSILLQYNPLQILYIKKKIYHTMLLSVERLLQTNLYLKNQIAIAIFYYGYQMQILPNQLNNTVLRTNLSQEV